MLEKIHKYKIANTYFIKNLYLLSNYIDNQYYTCRIMCNICPKIVMSILYNI